MVVEGSVDVGTVFEDGVDPGEGLGEFVSAGVHVEEGEDVDADDGVWKGRSIHINKVNLMMSKIRTRPWSRRIEVCLDDAIFVHEGEHLVHHAHLRLIVHMRRHGQSDGGCVEVSREDFRSHHRSTFKKHNQHIAMQREQLLTHQ